MTKMHRHTRVVHAKCRTARWLPFALGAAGLLGVALFLLPHGPASAPRWEASDPMQAGDLVAGRYRAGAEAAAVREPIAAKSERGGEQIWELEDVTLRFAGSPLRLIGADIRSADWAGLRGLRVGDALDALYKVIPVSEADEQPDDYVLLYAAGVAPDGLPIEPYAVIVPSGDVICAHLVSRTQDGSAFAICDIYANPDTDLVQRICWEVAPVDDFWERLME